MGGKLNKALAEKFTPEKLKDIERSERRREFIEKRVKQAERDEREGTAKPETIFAWQNRNAVTQDPGIDRDPSIIRRARRLPVKQNIVMPDGTFGRDLGGPGDAAYEAARQGIFCVHCRGRIPEDDGEWDYWMTKLEQRIGPCPDRRNRRERCCCCGGLLGFHGQDEDASMSPLTMTPEQQELMNRMAGPDWFLR